LLDVSSGNAKIQESRSRYTGLPAVLQVTVRLIEMSINGSAYLAYSNNAFNYITK